MAVQKSRVTRSRRGIRRHEDHIETAALTTDPKTGEVHRRHHITPAGYHNGRQVIAAKASESQDDAA